MSLNGPSAPLCTNDILELTCRLESDPNHPKNYKGSTFLQNGRLSEGTTTTIGISKLLTLAANEYSNGDTFVCVYFHEGGNESSNPYVVKKSKIAVVIPFHFKTH